MFLKYFLMLTDNKYSLKEKVAFLSNPLSYPDTQKVEVKETHMSWVFLTDHFVYKLKKPVRFDFLDFRTLAARHKYCSEEVRLNQALADDIYVGIVEAKTLDGKMRLSGEGEVIDWLVKMKRLPEAYTLENAIQNDNARDENVLQVAEKLVNFYITAPPEKIDPQRYTQQLLDDIVLDRKTLLRQEFKLSEVLISNLSTALLGFVRNHGNLLEKRAAEGKIIECHGDLKPEHIFLTPKPLIIDRLEFNKGLRILDVAEELSYLAMECEVLKAAHLGKLFINVYKARSKDNIPEVVIHFYKAKRAFLRAKLTARHLLEKKYSEDEGKWKSKCNIFLQLAEGYCQKLQMIDNP